MAKLKPYFLALLLAALPLSSFAQTDPDALNQAIRDSINTKGLGASYAAIVSFAVSPELSAATFNPDAGPGVIDPQLVTLKVPYRHMFRDDSARIRPFIQADFGYQKFDAGLDVAPGEFIDTEWKTLGGLAVGGAEIRMSEHFVIIPAITLGYASLENRSNYSGPVVEGVIGPALDGFVFNWDANALIYGASFGADYQRQLRGFELEMRGSLTHNIVDTIGSGDVSFRSGITTLDLEVNTVHPTGKTIGNSPLSWVAIVGHSRFFGSGNDALGFESFYEAGLALDLDMTAKGWMIKSLRFGAKAIFGEDVDGWGLIIGYHF